MISIHKNSKTEVSKKTITIFEHGFLPYDNELLNNRDEIIDLLGKLKSKGNKKIFTMYRDGIKASEQVGFVQVKDISIEILPKIVKKSVISQESESILSSRRNLLYMLQYCFDLPAFENELASMVSQKSNWFEILTFIFANNLQILLEKGAHKQYIDIEENMTTLKGKWLFTQHVRANPYQKHRFFVKYDEFSMDNLLNQILRFVTHKLKYQSKDVINRKKLHMLDMWMEDVNLVQIINPSDFERIFFTRQNVQFEPVINLAKLFILNQVIDVRTGNVKAFAFTFDMNLLFEQFVVKFLNEYKNKILPDRLKNCTIIPQAIGSIKYLATMNNKLVFRMQPDIILKNPNLSIPVIIDTKYKILNINYRKMNIKETDMYQMTAYLNTFNCNFCVLIYPQSIEIDKAIDRNFILTSNNSIIKVATIDLNKDLKNSTHELIKDFRNILNGCN